MIPRGAHPRLLVLEGRHRRLQPGHQRRVVLVAGSTEFTVTYVVDSGPKPVWSAQAVTAGSTAGTVSKRASTTIL